MDRPRILVVDDEPTICQLLKLNLEFEGWDVDTASSAEEALRLGPRLAGYSLMLLDVMMGEVDGFELARRLRRDPATAAIPLIFCTACCGEDDEVRGLEIGGEDYITKPFAMRTLTARVRRVLRRAEADAGQGPEGKTLVSGGLSLSLAAKTLSVDGVPVALTPNEFGLLAKLLEHPGRVYTRSELIEAVRGRGIVVLDRTIDVNIAHLRRKIAPYSSSIVTRPGFGYTFRE